jgi:tetratricopeptide (TPR) repeat protein
MDCRVSVVLGLGLLVGAGCTPSATTSAARDAQPVEVEPSAGQKRQTQAQIYVAAGDFCLREAEAPGKADADRQQLIEQARRSYRQALKSESQCLAAYRGMARSYLAEGKPAQAISAYRDCLKAHPKDAAVWYELGMAHGRLKQWEEAVEALEKACDYDPDNRQFANMLGYALAEVGAYEQSLACFRHTVGEARAHYALAKLLLRTDKPDLCRQQLNLALRADPTFKDAVTMLKQLDGSGLVPVQFQEPSH